MPILNLCPKKKSGQTLSGTFYIDKTELATTPTSCVHYQSGMSAAIAKTLVWNVLHPSVVKDGEVVYFLDKTDLTKKEDGTAANLDGTDGDVMVSIDPVWWKVTTNDSSKLEFKISNAAFDGAVTAHLFNGTVRKYLHLGMFHMPNQTDYAHSIYSTSLKPKASITNDAARTAATAKGDTYCTMTGMTWALIQILTVFASGSTNSQTTVGMDYTNTSHTETTYVATSAMLTANGYTSATKASDDTPLMWMFLSEPWGNVRDWISGFKSHSSVWTIINDQQQARSVAVTDPTQSSWTTLTHPTGTSGNYIKEAQGVNAAPLFGKTTGSTETTYYCDKLYFNTSTYRCANVGSYCYYGAYAGVFCMYAAASSSYATAHIGARLQCLDINTM